MKKTKYDDFLNELFNNLNIELEGKIKLNLDLSSDELYPYFDKSSNTIIGGYRFNILTLIFITNDIDAFLDYLFSIHSLYNHNVESCLYFGIRFKKKIKDKLLNIDEKSKEYIMTMHIIMTYFAYCHELGHAIFFNIPEEKNRFFEHIEMLKSNLYDLYNKYELSHDDFSWLDNFPKIVKDNVDINNLQSQTLNVLEDFFNSYPYVKEEVCADWYSISFLISNYSDEILPSLLYSAHAMIILSSRYTYLYHRFVKLEDDERYSHCDSVSNVRNIIFSHIGIMSMWEHNLDIHEYSDNVKPLIGIWFEDLNNYISSNAEYIEFAANYLPDSTIPFDVAETFINSIEEDILMNYFV